MNFRLTNHSDIMHMMNSEAETKDHSSRIAKARKGRLADVALAINDYIIRYDVQLVKYAKEADRVKAYGMVRLIGNTDSDKKVDDLTRSFNEFIQKEQESAKQIITRTIAPLKNDVYKAISASVSNDALNDIAVLKNALENRKTSISNAEIIAYINKYADNYQVTKMITTLLPDDKKAELNIGYSYNELSPDELIADLEEIEADYSRFIDSYEGTLPYSKIIIADGDALDRVEAEFSAFEEKYIKEKSTHKNHNFDDMDDNRKELSDLLYDEEAHEVDIIEDDAELIGADLEE